MIDGNGLAANGASRRKMKKQSWLIKVLGQVIMGK